jgi:hypothetical protein
MLGWQVCSVDIKPFEKIDMVMDMEFINTSNLPFIPDVGVFMPPCTTYSIAAISHHRSQKGYVAVSEFAKKSDRILENTIKLIKDILKANPSFKFYIENPVGVMRKMPIMKQFDRTTIYYCRYGDMRMKPTDIWTNDLRTMYNPDGWQPRKKCWNGNKKCQHEPAPRGSRTGTQGLKNDYERSKNPPLLVMDILNTYQQCPIELPTVQVK